MRDTTTIRELRKAIELQDWQIANDKRTRFDPAIAAAARAWLDQGDALVTRAAMLDVWLALGGDGPSFEAWMNERTITDAWAQLLAAVRGDLMAGDTNPEPGVILELVWKRWPDQGDALVIRRPITDELVERVAQDMSGRWRDNATPSSLALKDVRACIEFTLDALSDRSDTPDLG